MKEDVLLACAQAEAAQEPYVTALMKQALTRPHLVRTQFDTWRTAYDAANGAGASLTFLQQCLTAAGATTTLGQINTAFSAMESQALVLVNRRLNDGWTWEQIIAAIRAALVPSPPVEFSYRSLKIPPGYVTVWGEPW